MSLYNKLRRKLFPDQERFPDFLPQFRMEARSRDANSETALEMRIADPLWMLGRQWQFGEFNGEDNGSPISIKANHRQEKTIKYSFPKSTRREAIGEVPLEARVEAMEVMPTDIRSKVRIGQKFEDLIKAGFSKTRSAQFIKNLRREFPLSAEGQLDEKSRRYYMLMAGNVLDGGELWKKLKANKFPYGEYAALEAVSQKLKNWYQELFLPAGKQSSWNSRQLIHQFSIHGEKNVHLHAPDYQSGQLDWYSFDQAEIKIDPTQNTVDSAEFMPVRVSFAAMPEKRLFSFEDSKLDLTGMEVEKDDLVRLMILDFSLVSGSDWFIIPLEMGLGDLCWINHIDVKDVFGITTRINQSEGQFLSTNPLNVWDVFKVRERPVDQFKASEHFLYLAPVSSFRQESRPMEEILFLRDEYANMVWGIEKIVCNELGKPTNGYDLHLELNGPFQQSEAEEEQREQGLPRFRLASPVPTNWIPYLPFHIQEDNVEFDQNTDIELRRAYMMRNESNSDPEDILPLSKLASKDLLNIREEAIPRAGVRVQLTKQRVRGKDGKTYIWLGRKVLAGRGEGSSGLSFDQLLF